MQGVLYLEDTPASQGALRVVPGFHHRLARWSARQPADRSAERPEGKAAQLLEAEAISIAAKAGSLVVWHEKAQAEHCLDSDRFIERNSAALRYATSAVRSCHVRRTLQCPVFHRH